MAHAPERACSALLGGGARPAHRVGGPAAARSARPANAAAPVKTKLVSTALLAAATVACSSAPPAPENLSSARQRVIHGTPSVDASHDSVVLVVLDLPDGTGICTG